MELLSWRFWNSQLQRPTSVLGLKLWVVVGICAGAFLFLLLFLLPLCLSSRRRRRRRADDHPASSIPLHKLGDFKAPKVVHKEIPGVIDPPDGRQTSAAAAAALVAPQPAAAKAEIQIDIRRQERGVVVGEQQGHSSHGGSSRHAKHGASSAGTSGETHRSSETASMGRGGRVPEVSHLGWGHWYTLRELEEATGGLSPENVIGEGGYGIVYRGVLADDTTVAVKNLLNNRGQAEKEFKVEVEAIGRVRHKNLVRLLGYCVEGAYRMLVYEYLDNGNLNQWLHGDVGKSSPLSWDARMNIILGTAKGLAYLHEGLEPKVVHRDVKSSNILLDEQWNPKVSDFGLAKLLRSETNHVTTRVMGTFGYVAPEYASTGMLTERSDVYSFGVLVMEIISGRAPVDFTRPPEEIHLVEWLKMMVGEWKSDEVLDPRIPDRPSSKALKRALLVALRCVDPEARKRPKMGHVIHMFETDDLLLRDDRKIAQAEPGWQRDYSKRTLGRHNSNAVEASRNHDQEKWR